MIIEVKEESLTLEELSKEVEQLLARYGLLDGQPDGRVSAAPDGRTIRYYTTLGLLERPKVVGRQANYSRHHVLQLLAIKSLQGMSMPLAEIQARLYGKSNRELEAILEAISSKRKNERRASEEIRMVYWREVVIEPGLKIMAEDRWLPSDEEALESRIRAALAALRK